MGFIKDDRNIYCPHCSSIYIDKCMNVYNKPVKGLRHCNKCNKPFIVQANIKNVYTYKTMKA
jgi:transcription elongation factor Elf1